MSIIKSGSKLGNILRDLLNGLQGDMLGENYIYWIDGEQTFDSPEDNYSTLRKFISDSKKFMEVEIEYYKKYSPLIFHENAYKNVESGIELFEKIDKSL